MEHVNSVHITGYVHSKMPHNVVKINGHSVFIFYLSIYGRSIECTVSGNGRAEKTSHYCPPGRLITVNGRLMWRKDRNYWQIDVKEVELHNEFWEGCDTFITPYAEPDKKYKRVKQKDNTLR